MNVYNIIRTVILIAEAVLAVALIVTIFFQPANTTGISAIDNTETYYTKNKKKCDRIMKLQDKRMKVKELHRKKKEQRMKK